MTQKFNLKIEITGVTIQPNGTYKFSYQLTEDNSNLFRAGTIEGEHQCKTQGDKMGLHYDLSGAVGVQAVIQLACEDNFFGNVYSDLNNIEETWGS